MRDGEVSTQQRLKIDRQQTELQLERERQQSWTSSEGKRQPEGGG